MLPNFPKLPVVKPSARLPSPRPLHRRPIWGGAAAPADVHIRRLMGEVQWRFGAEGGAEPDRGELRGPRGRRRQGRMGRLGGNFLTTQKEKKLPTSS